MNKRKNIPLKLFTSFRKDENGVTAVEFGLLAVPFFSIIAIIMQTAVSFIAGMVLDNAVNDNIRLIRTGQAEAANFEHATFKAKICESTSVMAFDCNKIKIRVRTLANFAEGNAHDPILDPDTGEWDGDWDVANDYNDGVGGTVIIAEAYYKWDPVIDFTWLNIGASADGTILLGATRVWRNEPF